MWTYRGRRKGAGYTLDKVECGSSGPGDVEGKIGSSKSDGKNEKTGSKEVPDPKFSGLSFPENKIIVEGQRIDVYNYIGAFKHNRTQGSLVRS